MNIVRCNIQQFSDAKRSSAFSQMLIYMSYDATDSFIFFTTLLQNPLFQSLLDISNLESGQLILLNNN